MTIASRPSRRSSGVFAQEAGLIGVLAILLAVPGFIVAESWYERWATKRDWTIAGPPCPVVERPARAVVGSKPPRDFVFNGVTFRRHFGHVSCLAFREDGFLPTGHYSVCQFSGPGAVHVIRDGGTVVFQPGVGKNATVTVRRGQAACVVAGWFR